MESRQNLCELPEELERPTRGAERQTRLWRSVAYGFRVLGVLILLLPSVSAPQDSLEVEGNNFIVSSGSTIQSLSPSVAYNSDDNEYMVVWFDLRNQATTGNDVFGQRVSADGRLLGENIPIINEDGSQFGPFVAYNSIDNNYLVAWESQFDIPGSPDFNDAFGRLVSNEGIPLGSAFHISDAGLEISSAYNSTNNEYLVTGRVFASGPVPGILGQIVSNGGSLVGNEIVITASGAPAPNGQVIYNPTTNEYFATWRDQVDQNLKGQRISASGALIGNPIIISSVFPTSFTPTASIAYDSRNDRYLVVFAMFQGTEVLGQFVSSSGDLIGANFPILMLDSGETPSIVYSRIHNVYLIVWRNDNDIVAQLLSETGDRIGNPLLITNQGTAREGVRTVQNTTTGEFLVVWPDNRDISQGRQAIFAQLIRVKRGRTVCSFLGNDPRPSLLDQDIFTFTGTAGEEITVRVEQAPTGVPTRERVTLIVSGAIKGSVLVQIDTSALPNEITATLPATGTYLITIAEQPLLAPGERFRGDYCVTLESSGGAAQTLEPTAWVE